MHEHLIKAFNILNKIILLINLYDRSFYDIDIFSLIFYKPVAIFMFISNMYQSFCIFQNLES